MSAHNLYAGLTGSKVVIVTVPRADVEQCKTTPALVSLDALIASRDALAASNGTISLLLSGYDDDPRALHTIAEVRAYFSVLDEKFPYWFHVCNRLDHSLRMVFTMLVETTPVALDDPPSAIGYRFANDDLNDFVRHHLIAMDAIHTTHGFDPMESERISALIINYFSVTANG